MKISKTAVVSKNKLKRRVFFIIGTLFFSIGITGLLIPGLPTTIFMIIAAYFYFQSSNRFYNYIIQNDIFGDHVYNFLCGHGITKKAKQISLFSMWIFIFLGISLGNNSIPIYLILLIILIGLSGTVFILKQPTCNIN